MLIVFLLPLNNQIIGMAYPAVLLNPLTYLSNILAIFVVQYTPFGSFCTVIKYNTKILLLLYIESLSEEDKMKAYI